MTMTAPTRSAELHACRVRLARKPAAAAQARSHVRAAVCGWDAPVDVEVAILLTSELVTNAIRHTAGDAITLVIQCGSGQLRVDVWDTSPSPPVLIHSPADADGGRGLVLVARLSDEWGTLHIGAGKTVYFTLAFEPRLVRAGARYRARSRGVGHASQRDGRRAL